MRRILESLAFGVSEPQPGIFSVTVPSWRATKDVSIKDDLVEEVGRMIGYDSITPQAPLVPASVPPANPSRRFHHGVRNLFVDNGYTEVYNYSFLSEASVRAFGFDPAAHIRVTNPIASDQELMRASLLPGIWRNITENAKHHESFRLFEIGLEIHRREAGLPDEIPHLVAACYDRQGDGQSGLFELKRMAGSLLPGAQTVPVAAREFEHTARAAEIQLDGQTVGRLFELHPNLVETGRAAILDLDLRVIESLQRRRDQVHTHPPLPVQRLRPFRAGRAAGACRKTAGSRRRVRRSAARIHSIRAPVRGPADARRGEERLLPPHRRFPRTHPFFG